LSIILGNYICTYRVSGNNRQIFHEQVERTKLSRKVLYYFVNFPIVNEILILKDSRIRALAWPTTAKCICLPIVWCAGLGSWGLAGKRPAPRKPTQAIIARTARLPGYPRSSRPTRQAIDKRVHFAVEFDYF